MTAAEEAGCLDVAEDWRNWPSGARQWLRVLCLPIEGDEAWLPTPLESGSTPIWKSSMRTRPPQIAEVTSMVSSTAADIA